MSNGQGREAIDTVSFLAAELGLPIDTSWYVYIAIWPVVMLGQYLWYTSDRDDKDCVGDALTAFATKSSAAMLVCWEREYLPDIAEALGVNDVPSWPADRCVCFSTGSFLG